METVTDAITGPTPLGIMKEGLSAGKTVQEIMPQIPDYVTQLMTGFQGGSLGEVSALALILGAIYMLYRKIITWQTPSAYLEVLLFLVGFYGWLILPYVDPVFHLVTGGMMLGVFYMATDMVTSPMSSKGQLIFGAGAGILNHSNQGIWSLSGRCFVCHPDYECICSLNRQRI